MDVVNRMTRIASKAAHRRGARASVYADSQSFDILTERWTRKRDYEGMAWVSVSMEDVYRTPPKAAQQIRAEMKRIWA